MLTHSAEKHCNLNFKCILGKISRILPILVFLNNAWVVFNQYSILIGIEAIGLVILCKNFNKLNLNFNFIRNPRSKLKKFVSLIAEYSYGMFLIHVAFFATLLRILPYGLLGYKLSLLTFLVEYSYLDSNPSLKQDTLTNQYTEIK